MFEKVKEKAVKVKEFVTDNLGAIVAISGTVFVVGLCAYLKGMNTGMKYIRREWDFTKEDAANSYLLVDKDGEYRGALPGNIIQAALDMFHKASVE